MTICYFGIYNPDYSRNRILIKGLRENGVEIIECQSDLGGVRKYFDLIKKHRAIKNKYDLMIVGFPGYQAMILARILTRKKIIFDAFASFYDSMVLDRKLVEKYSFSALYFWLLDFLACFLADKILLDTNEQINYFVETFKIKKEKFIRVFVGSDDKLLKPEKETIDKNYFLVVFFGSFIPLQGVDYIIKAARILENENVRFRIIGTKIKSKYQNNDLKNIEFLDNVPYEKLSDYITRADASLGIFGDTAKAKRVIPNKVYESLAVGTAIITGESAAVRELLENRKNVLFCNLADGEDLAKKILELKVDSGLRNKISQNGYKLFVEKLTPKIIVREMLAMI